MLDKSNKKIKSPAKDLYILGNMKILPLSIIRERVDYLKKKNDTKSIYYSYKKKKILDHKFTSYKSILQSFRTNTI